MQMKEAKVVLHPKVPDLQILVMHKKWWWYDIINGETTTNPFQDQES